MKESEWNKTQARGRPLFAVACKGSELAAAVLAVTGGETDARAVERFAPFEAMVPRRGTNK